MDLTKVLAQLRLELDHIDAAILSLERLQVTGGRRGRPPRYALEVRKSKAAAGRRTLSPPRRAERGGPSDA